MRQALRKWLSHSVVGLGIAALFLEILNKLYFQVGIGYLSKAAIDLRWTFAESEWVAHASTSLDIIASIAAWLFSFGFLFRIIDLFEKK